MKRKKASLLVLVLSLCVVTTFGLCACGGSAEKSGNASNSSTEKTATDDSKSAVESESTSAAESEKAAEVVLPEGAYEEESFWFTVLDGWEYSEQYSKSAGDPIVGRLGDNGAFSYSDKPADPYWLLDVGRNWNAASVESLADAPLAWAQQKQKDRNGTELVEMEIDGQKVWMTSYPKSSDATLNEYVFQGTSEIQKPSDGNGSIYYNITLTLKDCSPEHYEEALKMLDNIHFKFVYDFTSDTI